MDKETLADGSKVNAREVLDATPHGLLQDLQHMGGWKDEFTQTEVQLFRDNELILLEAEKILIATHPKGADLAESIIVHPRYANKKNFDIVEIKGYRNGRNIDILLPMPVYLDGEFYNIINIKGVGASTHDANMVIDPERWYDWNNKQWMSFNESKASLGRRWGMLDTYAGTAEYSNNVFLNLGIEQVPHLRINHAPPGILPFEGVTQLVRGLKTNVRCDNDFANGWLQKQYISGEMFSHIDAKVFAAQKELFKEHKAITQPIGRVIANRYLDGKYTDMENYFIKQYGEEKELIRAGATFCMDAIGSVAGANNDNRRGYVDYLRGLQSQTGIPLLKYKDVPVEIFIEQYLSKEKQSEFFSIAQETFTEFKKDYAEYLKN